MAAKRAIYLGLDASTQSLSATALEASTMRAVFTASVNYDADLPSFDTKGGFHQADDGRVTSPTAMVRRSLAARRGCVAPVPPPSRSRNAAPPQWVSALDELLRRMESDGFPFGSVRALSGSGQQHGSVYWRRGAAAQLGALRAAEPLAPQLADAFSVPESPIWADSSTGAQCRALTDALGGPLAVAELTGSRCVNRNASPPCCCPHADTAHIGCLPTPTVRTSASQATRLRRLRPSRRMPTQTRSASASCLRSCPRCYWAPTPPLTTPTAPV